MTENEFWAFLNGMLKNGRQMRASFTRDTADPAVRKVMGYLESHCMLPTESDRIPHEKIVKMGKLLTDRKTANRTKEAILIILAHYVSPAALDFVRRYSFSPDRGMESFAKLALEECLTWNEKDLSLGRNVV